MQNELRLEKSNMELRKMRPTTHFISLKINPFYMIRKPCDFAKRIKYKANDISVIVTQRLM